MYDTFAVFLYFVVVPLTDILQSCINGDSCCAKQIFSYFAICIVYTISVRFFQIEWFYSIRRLQGDFSFDSILSSVVIYPTFVLVFPSFLVFLLSLHFNILNAYIVVRYNFTFLMIFLLYLLILCFKLVK